MEEAASRVRRSACCCRHDGGTRKFGAPTRLARTATPAYRPDVAAGSGYLPTVITEWSAGGAPSPWGAKSIVCVPRDSGLIRAAYPNPPKLIVPPPGSPKMLFSGHGTVV